MNFIVTEAAMRPASPERRCFYCQRAVGENHDLTQCVLVQRRVVLRLEVRATVHDYEVDVPVGWTKENIEFHRNLGTWCADNVLRDLEKAGGAQHVIDKLVALRGTDEDGPCLCEHVSHTYLRDVEGVRGEPFCRER